MKAAAQARADSSTARTATPAAPASWAPACPRACSVGGTWHVSSGAADQGLVLRTLVEFPGVLSLNLVDDGERAGDGSANRSDLGEFGTCAACHFVPPSCHEGLKS